MDNTQPFSLKPATFENSPSAPAHSPGNGNKDQGGMTDNWQTNGTPSERDFFEMAETEPQNSPPLPEHQGASPIGPNDATPKMSSTAKGKFVLGHQPPTPVMNGTPGSEEERDWLRSYPVSDTSPSLPPTPSRPQMATHPPPHREHDGAPHLRHGGPAYETQRGPGPKKRARTASSQLDEAEYVAAAVPDASVGEEGQRDPPCQTNWSSSELCNALGGQPAHPQQARLGQTHQSAPSPLPQAQRVEATPRSTPVRVPEPDVRHDALPPYSPPDDQLNALITTIRHEDYVSFANYCFYLSQGSTSEGEQAQSSVESITAFLRLPLHVRAIFAAPRGAAPAPANRPPHPRHTNTAPSTAEYRSAAVLPREQTDNPAHAAAQCQYPNRDSPSGGEAAYMNERDTDHMEVDGAGEHGMYAGEGGEYVNAPPSHRPYPPPQLSQAPPRVLVTLQGTATRRTHQSSQFSTLTGALATGAPALRAAVMHSHILRRARMRDGTTIGNRADVLTRNGTLAVLKRPQDGFPTKHAMATHDLLRNIPREKVDDWVTKLPKDTRVIVEIHWQGEMDGQNYTQALCDLVFDTIALITETNDFDLVAPEPPADPNKPRDIPTGWLVYNLTPEARARLLENEGIWPTPLITLYVHPDFSAIPEYLLTYKGFQRGDDKKIRQAIVEVLGSDKHRSDLVMRIATARGCTTPARCDLELANLTIEGIWIKVSQAKTGPDAGMIIVAVYCVPPFTDAGHWTSWRDSLFSLTLTHSYNSPAIPHYPTRCRGCHVGDHETAGCPFKAVAGWYGKLIIPNLERANAHAGPSAQPQGVTLAASQCGAQPHLTTKPLQRQNAPHAHQQLPPAYQTQPAAYFHQMQIPNWNKETAVPHSEPSYTGQISFDAPGGSPHAAIAPTLLAPAPVSAPLYFAPYDVAGASLQNQAPDANARGNGNKGKKNSRLQGYPR
ncbi:hypothetical protein TRAPUB_351 [Trametes pubescens]|uniref:Uncharacterized protein n=1 Tax=Trametes pubescens TaxID=154538 RepID=A0A1M2VMB7_TRAPU|nr:hypothetical protein TRAPUB_351 [Trametes pubescens]